MSGDDAIDKAIRSAREPARDDNLPIVPLGHRNGSYFFLSGAAEIRELKPRDFTANGMASLFDGDRTWLFKHHAKLDSKDRPTGEIDVGSAAATLMQRCRNAGLWRTDTPRRLIGVWLGAREVVAHCGDTIFLYVLGQQRRSRMPAGQHLDGAIYLGAPPIQPPASAPAAREDVQKLFDAVDQFWNFAELHHSRMVIGFLGLAMLGAAPAWRVHLLLKGIRGRAGKTTLLKLLAAGLGPQASFINDPTEAGLRESLTDEARTIIFDEAGARGGDDRSIVIESIIGLLRRMAGDEGARSVRGSGSGARHYTMAGSCVLAAANAPMLDAQDRSRILEIEMLPADPANKAKVDATIKHAHRLSPALRARALLGFSQFAGNVEVYHKALLEIGCDARQADQIGTLLAAAEMMLSDAPAKAAVLEDLEAFKSAIGNYITEDTELSNAQRCLGVLFSTQIEHWKGGAKSTLGRLVQLARREDRADDKEALKNYGLRLVRKNNVVQSPDFIGPPTPFAQELWVANQHRGLDKVFAGTDWRNGAWRDALKQLPGARGSGRTEWFDAAKVRFVIVPDKLLPPAAILKTADGGSAQQPADDDER